MRVTAKTPLLSAEMSMRLANILQAALDDPPDFVKMGIAPSLATFGDAARWSEAELRALPRMGPKSYAECIDLLETHGFSVRDPSAPTCRRRGCPNAVRKEGDVCKAHRCAQPGCGRFSWREGRCADHQTPPDPPPPSPTPDEDLEIAAELVRHLRKLPEPQRVRVWTTVCTLTGMWPKRHT